MRAVVFEQSGGPDVLRVKDLPVPEPSPGEVRVQVRAASVNPADLAARSGALAAFLPEAEYYVLGWDFAGEVSAFGPGVTELSIGERVFGMSDWFAANNGTQAEQVVLPLGSIGRVPTGLDLVPAATLGLNALTADQALDLLAVQPGQTLAVIGAAGAVGGFATRLAALRGVQVIGVAGAADQSTVTAAGARFAPRDDLAGLVGRADAVLDTALLGGPALALVRDGGAYANVFAPALPKAERGVRMFGVAVQSNGSRSEKLAQLVAGGELDAPVARTMPLEEVATAHSELAAGGTRGRIVLVP